MLEEWRLSPKELCKESLNLQTDIVTATILYFLRNPKCGLCIHCASICLTTRAALAH